MDMASLSAARPANVMFGFSSRALIPTINAIRLCTRASSVSSKLRFDGVTRSQISERHVRVCATNPATGSGNGKTGSEETSEGSSEGPPLLTILAGASVFLFFCWLIGSFVMWLITLILNLASPK